MSEQVSVSWDGNRFIINGSTVSMRMVDVNVARKEWKQPRRGAPDGATSNVISRLRYQFGAKKSKTLQLPNLCVDVFN